ncbi:DUF7144 family membrane protein [Actinokineospora enzanensis]|uniref:DUF7144 family membrane protein n=1 Tax=Actinokineospora enzanensis TaxID=155975 RepID=UPI00035FA549|nr:hypothetical protein [Actinokineospora enzanensis]
MYRTVEQTRTDDDGYYPRRDSAWVGWIWFGAVMMILVGLFTVVNGLVALFQDEYYTVTAGRLLVFDLTGWGWLHLIVGIVVTLAGFALFTGAIWARVAAVVLAGINALTQLAFLPAYPVWSIIAIVLDVVVIWAVVVYGREVA